MQKYNLCCVGHLTLDNIITPKKSVNMPGGTTFYASNAIRNLNNISYILIASLAESEMQAVEDLRAKGLKVQVVKSKHSLHFENKYGENQNNRTQRVLAKADPIGIENLDKIEANVFLLGTLMADDFSLEFIKSLSEKGLIAIDAQGFLREVRDKQVYAVDWKDKIETLKYVYSLKVNEVEMEVLTGEKDIKKAAQTLYDWGVKEVLVTLGSLGSVIFDGKEFYKIPAYEAHEVVDATGCGDTYVVGYLYQRVKGKGIEEAGKFAAAMATIKIEGSGPFSGTEEDVMNRIKNSKPIIPEI